MNRNIIILLLTMLLVGCSHQPQTLDDVKSEYITIDDGVKIHYKIWNKTADTEVKTLCFVHGFGCDMNTWEKQFEAFRDEDVQLLFIDLPGYGMSDKPVTDYTFDFFARAIDGVLNTNGITDAVFVGHSLGTPVCRHTLMTTAHGGALVDVDGVYCFYDGSEIPEYMEAVEQFGHSFDGPDCREVITGFVSSLAGKDTPQWVTDYAMSVMPETPQYVASSTMQHLVERKWWPNCRLSLPVMVICTQNSGLEADNEQKMRALYPQLDYTELTTCGHFIHMEQAEMFNEKLKEFITIKEKEMPITVNIKYTGVDGNALKFAEEMTASGTVAAIRAEEGNLRYEYYQSLDDPETLLLIDSWASQEAIDRHHATPMMATIAALREKYDLHMTVTRYTPADQPEADERFIRK